MKIIKEKAKYCVYQIAGTSELSTYDVASFINDQFDQPIQLDINFLIDDERSDNEKILNCTLVNSFPLKHEDNIFDQIYNQMI